MKHYLKYLWKLRDGEKIPRKAKKEILGCKLSKKEIQKKIKNFKVVNSYATHTEYNTIPFCPECGCTLTNSTGNMAGYPEVYLLEYCLRCGKLVAMADNSKLYHCLEFDNFELG